MLIHRSYHHKLQLTPSQEETCAQYAGCTRLLYNLALEEREMVYKLCGKGRVNYQSLTTQLTDLKTLEGCEWLQDVPVTILRGAFKNLDSAFTAFFEGRSGYPRYKRRYHDDSFRAVTDYKFAEGRNGSRQPSRVHLSKGLGWVSVHNAYPRLRREGKLFEGEICHMTVKREANGWLLSITCVIEDHQPVPRRGGLPNVGIDLGIKNSVTLSSGEQYHFPVISKSEWAHIGHLQQQITRCQKGSHRQAKLRGKLARYHGKLRRRKVNALHNLSTALVAEHGSIFAEDLRIKNMSASAKGTIEEPGKNVAQKAGLNREILNQCWGEFLRQLSYKSSWAGEESFFARVRSAYSSQECSICGYTNAGNRPSQSEFHCLKCGHKEHADANAASVILNRGLQPLATEDCMSVSKEKQVAKRAKKRRVVSSKEKVATAGVGRSAAWEDTSPGECPFTRERLVVPVASFAGMSVVSEDVPKARTC